MKNRLKGHSRSISAAVAPVIEALETRQMLSTTVTATPASLQAPSTYTWSGYMQMMGLDKLTQQYPSLTGKGEAIVVIDTGVDYNNPALGGGFGSGYKVEAGYNYAGNSSDPMNISDPHGTATAGVAAALPYYVNGVRYQGVAPGANIIAFECTGGYQIASALDWVIANASKYNIVAVDQTDFTGPWYAYQSEVTTLTKMNVFMSCPAGNGGASDIVAANIYNNLWAIGGVTTDGSMWSGSARGPNTVLVAPADQLMVPYYGSGQQIYYDGASGTSWSGPEVAGAAAIIRQINPNWTPLQVVQILQAGADKVYDSASNYTYDRLNVYNAVKVAYQMMGQSAPTPAPAPAPTPAPTPSSGGSTPFSTVNIGSSGSTTIQAENFDFGGQGVAYQTPLSGNPGSASYRNESVGFESTSDSGGGYDVGWVNAGDWFKYTANFASSGTYTISTRVADAVQGGTFHIDIDGKAVTGELTVSNTGGWQTWSTVSATGVSVSAGSHVVELVADTNGANGYVGNFNWLQFTAGSSSSSSSTATPSASRLTASTPYQGIPDSSMVQNENYDSGGEGVAYHTASTSNLGGQYRNDGVSIENSTDSGGGYDVGWVTAGNWYQYTVNFATTKTYTFGARVSAATAGGTFHVEVDGVAVGGEITVPNTGGYQNWTGVFAQVAVTAGVHKVRLVMDTAGTNGYVGNFNWFRFV